jgi:hypothetical protein
VKRSGRDESIQVVIHMCMETMLGISLYLKLAKMLSFLFSLQQNWRKEQVLPGSQEGGGEEKRDSGERWSKHEFMNT